MIGLKMFEHEFHDLLLRNYAKGRKPLKFHVAEACGILCLAECAENTEIIFGH